MEQMKDFPISLDSVLEDARKKNEAISALSQEADDQLSVAFEAHAANQRKVLEDAERHVGDSTNALILCTKKAVQETDESLTRCLLNFYVLLEEGTGL